MPIHRTPSESLLASLHLNFSDLALAHPRPQRPSSFLTDEELSDVDLPMLGQSVMEEQADRFALQASKALSFLATPPPSNAEGGASGDVYSPYQSRSPVPDAEGDVNPYFIQHRALYHDGAPGSVASSSSASSSADDSGYSSPASEVPSCDPSPSLKAVDTSLAARRGKAMRIALPPIPTHAHLAAAVARPPRPSTSPKQVTGFNFTVPDLQEGVLKNNFAGVQLRRSPPLAAQTPTDTFSVEETLPLRRKRRDHGFAF